MPFDESQAIANALLREPRSITPAHDAILLSVRFGDLLSRTRTLPLYQREVVCDAILFDDGTEIMYLLRTREPAEWLFDFLPAAVTPNPYARLEGTPSMSQLLARLSEGRRILLI